MNDDLTNTTLRELWFEHDGTPLFAVESGQGRPIILLHSGLADHLACRLFTEPLSRFRVITPDLRAAGRSVYTGALGWARFADDVAALVKHLGLRRPVVGGISFGSAVAVRVALQYPELLGGLVLLTPAYAGADVGQDALRPAVQAMHAAATRALDEGPEALYPLFGALPEPSRARARAMVDTFDMTSVAASTRFMLSGEAPFSTARDLESSTVPTLLVPGTDPFHPPALAELDRRHLPRCTVQNLTPAEYGEAIAAFIDRIDRELGEPLD